MNTRREFILRLIACILAVVLFFILSFGILTIKLDEAGIGAAKIAPKELVGIAYFQSL